MKTLIQATTGIFMLLFNLLTAGAQDDRTYALAAPGIRFSIGIDGGLPTGNFENYSNLKLGRQVQADTPVSQALYIPAATGYDNNLAEARTRYIGRVPVKAGLKYFAADNPYVQGEAGVSFITNRSEYEFDKAAVFVYAPQVAYLFHIQGVSYVDAGLRFETNTRLFPGATNAGFFGLRFAYAFSL